MEFVFYEGIGGLPHFNPDLDGEGAVPPAAIAEFRALLAAADGVIISCPEYAHGVPGSLKNALDWIVSSGELTDKPLVLVNASAAGGERAQAALVETLTVMGANVLVEASLLAPFLRKKLEGQGGVLDTDAAQALRSSLVALALAITAR
jgi:chromate reductase, NAD(P)H dehydrogenase (quinone)